MLSLEDTLINMFYEKIKNNQLCFHKIRDQIPEIIADKIMDKLIQHSKFHFNTRIHSDLKSELMVNTAINLDVYEDMRVVIDHDGMPDRAYVRDIYMELKQPRIFWFIVDEDDLDMNDMDEETILDISLCWDDNYQLIKKIADCNEMYVVPFELSRIIIRDHEDVRWDNLYKFVEAKFDNCDSDEESYSDKFSDW